MTKRAASDASRPLPKWMHSTRRARARPTQEQPQCRRTGMFPKATSDILLDSGTRSPHRKKEAILQNEETKDFLVTSGYYVFCKRFSSKEEKKRIEEKFSKALGAELKINFVETKTIPPLKSGKYTYIISRLKNEEINH